MHYPMIEDVKLRVSPDMKRAIEARARESGKTVSVFVREVMANHLADGQEARAA